MLLLRRIYGVDICVCACVCVGGGGGDEKGNFPLSLLCGSSSQSTSHSMLCTSSFVVVVVE